MILSMRIIEIIFKSYLCANYLCANGIDKYRDSWHHQHWKKERKTSTTNSLRVGRRAGSKQSTPFRYVTERNK